jgi:hypothetical protein
VQVNATALAVQDPPLYPEANFPLSWAVNPNVSWMDYRCWVEIELDPGMWLHKALPQQSTAVDDLAQNFITDAKLGKATNPSGVNVASNSLGQDTIQRMATSTYTFYLRGWGVRIGYQIPIPGLKSVGKQTCVPKGPQRAANLMIGNCGGQIPLWFAYWDLSYMVAGPLGPKAVAPIPPNLAAHISYTPGKKLPDFIPPPWSTIDPRAVQQAAPPIGPALPPAGPAKPQNPFGGFFGGFLRG